jgi:hypothetical protein
MTSHCRRAISGTLWTPPNRRTEKSEFEMVGIAAAFSSSRKLGTQ